MSQYIVLYTESVTSRRRGIRAPRLRVKLVKARDTSHAMAKVLAHIRLGPGDTARVEACITVGAAVLAASKGGE